jgi:hypothetical protein
MALCLPAALIMHVLSYMRPKGTMPHSGSRLFEPLLDVEEVGPAVRLPRDFARRAGTADVV